MKRIIITIIVAVVGGGAYLFWMGRSHQSVKAIHISRVPQECQPEQRLDQEHTAVGDVAELRQKVVALTSELESLHDEVSRRPELDPRHAETVSRKNSGPRRDPAAREEAELERHARLAHIEASFLNESRDPIWSSNMTSTIRDAARNDETMRRALGNVECRSKTCRVELADEGTGVVGQNVALFLMNLGEAAGSTVADRVDQGNGHKTTVLYLSRPNGT